MKFSKMIKLIFICVFLIIITQFFFFNIRKVYMIYQLFYLKLIFYLFFVIQKSNFWNIKEVSPYYLYNEENHNLSIKKEIDMLKNKKINSDS